MDRACSPPIGNLASGRSLTTLSNCCGNCSSVTPDLCPENKHPSAHMNDNPFSHPATWWASGAGTTTQDQHDEIQLDLETQFCFSYVVLVFRSPRPSAMAIERSADFGKTWETLKFFANNCSEEFGLADDFSLPGSLCTSRYTSVTPCSGGEVRKYTVPPSHRCDISMVIWNYVWSWVAKKKKVAINTVLCVYGPPTLQMKHCFLDVTA